MIDESATTPQTASAGIIEPARDQQQYERRAVVKVKSKKHKPKKKPKASKHRQRRRSSSAGGLDMIGVNDRFVEAAGEARVDFVIQRIQDGQDVDHVHTLLGYTALHAAADVAGARGGVNLGQLEIVYLLLQVCTGTACLRDLNATTVFVWWS